MDPLKLECTLIWDAAVNGRWIRGDRVFQYTVPRTYWRWISKEIHNAGVGGCAGIVACSLYGGEQRTLSSILSAALLDESSCFCTEEISDFASLHTTAQSE